MIDQMESMSRYETVLAFQNLLISIATGGSDDGSYVLLRKRLLDDAVVGQRLPSYAKVCRDAAQFWSFIKRTERYQPRRELIWRGFQPILDFLEGGAPPDEAISDALKSLDAESVQRHWQRALDRRATDPEAALTSARTLLESTCKHILDDAGVGYEETDDLPKLYKSTARTLNLAPDQHTEQIFKQILGGCQTVVEGLGAMRSKLSDAHGRGRRGARPADRHAELAVNLAGAMATFLVRTWQFKKDGAVA